MLSLSPDSLYLRYFHAVSVNRLIAHDQLARMCFVDYDREMALVAVRIHPKSGQPQVLAHGQITKLHGANEAEFALQVRDEFQGMGLGAELLHNLLDIARSEGIDTVLAEIMPENTAMRHVCTRLGFEFKHVPDSPIVVASINLSKEPSEHAVRI
jgi:acetyltransferase